MIQRAIDPELVVGVVTPIGTNTAELVAAIRGELANWAYASQTVKLSTLLPVEETPVGESEDERVERLIKAGNRFCREHVSLDRPHGDPAAVARLAVKRIRELRRAYQRSSESRATPCRFAYVIHSLKRPAEVNLLREIYGPQFVLLASQGTSDERLQNLMTRPLSAASDEAKREIARRLMVLDAREEGDAVGQLVNDTYPLADFFLHGTDVARTFQVLFGDPTQAPTIAEYAMYVAHATRARSLAGSRKPHSSKGTASSQQDSTTSLPARRRTSSPATTPASSSNAPTLPTRCGCSTKRGGRRPAANRPTWWWRLPLARSPAANS